MTLRSTWHARAYEPGGWAERVWPTPLLMVVAEADNITMTDLELAAFARALEPKKLKMISGGHFDPYGAGLAESSGAAIDWFCRHLGPKPVRRAG